MATDHGELGNYNGDVMSAKFWAADGRKHVLIFLSGGGGKNHVLDDLKEIERGLMYVCLHLDYVLLLRIIILKITLSSKEEHELFVLEICQHPLNLYI
jgi:hypothetical protein